MLKPISNKRHLGCETRKFPEVILQQHSPHAPGASSASPKIHFSHLYISDLNFCFGHISVEWEISPIRSPRSAASFTRRRGSTRARTRVTRATPTTTAVGQDLHPALLWSAPKNHGQQSSDAGRSSLNGQGVLAPHPTSWRLS